MSENRVSNEIHRSSHKQIHRKLSNSHLDYCYEEDYDNKITKIRAIHCTKRSYCNSYAFSAHSKKQHVLLR